MKSTSLFLLALSVTLLVGCGGNDVQIPDTPLSGMVAGEEWEFQYANAFTNANRNYTVKFLSTLETANDPCAIPSPGNTFVSMAVPLEIGSFSIPFVNADQSPRFHISPSNSVIATSGFLEIIDIRNAVIFGYLQAQLDDDNTVEGRFEVIICN